jgi:hypothetical protein
MQLTEKNIEGSTPVARGIWPARCRLRARFRCAALLVLCLIAVRKALLLPDPLFCFS